MSLYDETIPTFLLTLQSLDSWLQKAIDNADSRGFDAEKLLAGRLAPDQFDLTRQIQTACDTAKLCGARLAGAEAPPHADGPATMAELRTRITDVRTFLGELSRDDVEGGADTVLSPGFLRGGSMTAANLARELLPAQLLLPRGDGLRHPPPPGRAPGQDGLHRAADPHLSLTAGPPAPPA
jgi:hypothetical protein